MPENTNASPGLSIANLIEQVDAKHLPALVGPSVINVLRLLDPTLAEPEKLRALATRLIDPEAALKAPLMLDALIGVQAGLRHLLLTKLPAASASEIEARLDNHGPVPFASVQEAQRAVVDTLCRLSRAGQVAFDDPEAMVA